MDDRAEVKAEIGVDLWFDSMVRNRGEKQVGKYGGN